MQHFIKNFNFGYIRDSIDATKALLYSFDNFLVEMNYDLYVRLYANLYLCYLRSNDPIMIDIISNKIRYYYKTNSYFKHQYHQLKNLVGLNDFIIYE